MAILIKSTELGYEAVATPPHVGAPWQTSAPSSARALIAALLERGCHQTDIGDAFYSANPNWLSDMSPHGLDRVQT